jgi:hypothetical protein
VKIVKRNNIQAGMVAHACNSSYSRDRDLEDHGSRSAWAKTGDPIPKLMKAKIAGVMTQVEHPPNKQEVQTPYHQNKQKEKQNSTEVTRDMVVSSCDGAHATFDLNL